MTRETIGRIFNRRFNGQRNFMTPYLVEYGETPKGYIYELSKGTGFDREPIYGVTVLTRGGSKTQGISKGGFLSEREAKNYIESI